MPRIWKGFALYHLVRATNEDTATKSHTYEIVEHSKTGDVTTHEWKIDKVNRELGREYRCKGKNKHRFAMLLGGDVSPLTEEQYQAKLAEWLKRGTSDGNEEG